MDGGAARGPGRLYAVRPWPTTAPMAPAAEPRLLARKSIEEALAETERSGFKRALGLVDLTSIGVAAIIGAGIFFFLGDQARTTGPAVMISLIVGGIAAILSAFTYAEFASLIPG